MNIAWILLYTLVTHGLEIVIFFKMDGIGLTFERIFKAFLFKILLAFVFVMISYIVGNIYLSYFMEPLYGKMCIRDRASCSTCNGSGAKPGTSPVTC